MDRSKVTHGMIERLLVINNDIGTGKYPNTPKLAKKLEVRIATISRDVEFLRDRLNAPIEYSFEKKGYYYKRKYQLFGEFENYILG